MIAWWVVVLLDTGFWIAGMVTGWTLQHRVDKRRAPYRSTWRCERCGDELLFRSTIPTWSLAMRDEAELNHRCGGTL